MKTTLLFVIVFSFLSFALSLLNIHLYKSQNHYADSLFNSDEYNKNVVSLLHGSKESKLALLDRIGNSGAIGSIYIDAISEMTKSRDDSIVEKSLETLIHVGVYNWRSPNVASRCLYHINPSIRELAADYLYNMGPYGSKSIEDIIYVAKNERITDIKRKCIMVIGNHKYYYPIVKNDIIEQFVKNDDCFYMADIISDFGDDQSRAALIKGATSKNKIKKATSITALGRLLIMNNEPINPVIESGIDDEDVYVKICSAIQLLHFDPQSELAAKSIIMNLENAFKQLSNETYFKVVTIFATKNKYSIELLWKMMNGKITEYRINCKKMLLDIASYLNDNDMHNRISLTG